MFIKFYVLEAVYRYEYTTCTAARKRHNLI